MLANSVTIADNNRREVRVTFDPDGTAFYCGNDVAALTGYKAPRRLIMRIHDIYPDIDIAIREFAWLIKNTTPKKRHVCKMRCFDEESALKFLERYESQNEATRWFSSQVIPQVRQMSEARAKKAEAEKDDKPEPAHTEAETPRSDTPDADDELHTPMNTKAIVDRLDAIILECVLLKRELNQKTK